MTVCGAFLAASRRSVFGQITGLIAAAASASPLFPSPRLFAPPASADDAALVS